MIAGRYSLTSEIARGGMGAVWLGRDEVLGRVVALKRVGMVPGAGGPDLARAEREGRLAAALNHPHVVSVYDLVADEDAQWLVMEYVDGLDLARVVRRDGPLATDRAARLLGQAADALAAAHAAGIVHRDVKPSNILVDRDDTAHLTDFGIARAEADVTLTATGLVTGSPAYLAPEVASGHTAAPPGDVWSLGATLFHALSGHPPYDVGDNLIGAMYRIVHDDPPRLDGAGPMAPLLEATMAKDPADRWSMAQVRDALREVGRGPAVTATRVVPAVDTRENETVAPPPTPVPAPAPAPPPERRRRVLPVLLALAVLVAAGVGVWALLNRGDDPQGGATGAPTPRETPTSATPGTTATAAGMRSFIEDYLATVTERPEDAWQSLTPAFREASGGFASYSGFWGSIRSARATGIQADPASLTVAYTARYVRDDGSRTTDQVDLQLVLEGGAYLIAGEA